MNAQTQIAEREQIEIAPPAPKGNVVPMPPQGVPRAYPPKIARALLDITREIGAVAKHGKNTFHNYQYQKWEDVLNVIAPLLTTHGIIIQQSEVARSLFENEQLMSITYAFTIINEDGDAWPDQPVWTAIARARDQKGVPDDKSANKCHTQAHKYFLLHLFKIKTQEAKDDDSDGDETAAGKRKPPKPPKPDPSYADAGYVAPTGHSFETWAEAYEKALAATKTTDEATRLAQVNAALLARLKAGRPALYERVTKSVKPPKPTAPAADAMPSPDKAAEWLGWLIKKLAGFDSYEAGEVFWNDKIEALDLSRETQEDAMGAWRRFEQRFE